MKTTKLIILHFYVIVLALGCSVSYAQENDDSAFITGRMGSNVGTSNCSGNCSAAPSTTIGIGFTGADHSDLASFIFRESISFDYSRYQFNFNGNVVNVAEKAIHIHLETALKAHPKFILAVKLGPSLTTASSMNTPDRTVFGGSGGIDLLYQVVPSLYWSLGFSSVMIHPANQPDFFSDTVDVGLRWHL